MSDTRLTIVGNIGAAGINGSISRSTTGVLGVAEPIVAGITGTYVSATVFDLTAGHGLGDGAHTMDVFWVVAGVPNKLLGATVTIVTDEATITFGTGDALPTSGTLVVSYPVTIAFPVEADDLAAVGCIAAQNLYVAFIDDAAATAYDVYLPANEPWFWMSGGGMGANPMAADTIVSVKVSNRTATATTVNIGASVDPTP